MVWFNVFWYLLLGQAKSFRICYHYVSWKA